MTEYLFLDNMKSFIISIPFIYCDSNYLFQEPEVNGAPIDLDTAQKTIGHLQKYVNDIKKNGYKAIVDSYNDKIHEAALIENSNHINKPKKINAKGFIYVICDSRYYKIGFSKSPKERLRNFKTSNILIETTAIYEGCFDDEKALHEHFSEFKIMGEWFNLTQDHLSYIEEYFKK